MSANEEEVDLDAIAHVFATYYACIFAVVVWDWLSCLPSEYELVWKSRWSVMKSLYLLTRYWGLATIGATLPAYHAHWTRAFCQNFIYAASLMRSVTSLSGAAILLIRCYAVWEFNKRIFTILIILLAHQAAWQVFNTFHTFEPNPVPHELGPCYTAPRVSDGWLVLGYGTSAFLFSVVVTGLTMHKSMQLHTNGVRSGLLNLIICHGILYYIATTILWALKVAFEVRGLYPAIKCVNAVGALSLIPVLICRLVLSLRRRGREPPEVFSWTTPPLPYPRSGQDALNGNSRYKFTHKPINIDKTVELFDTRLHSEELDCRTNPSGNSAARSEIRLSQSREEPNEAQVVYTDTAS